MTPRLAGRPAVLGTGLAVLLVLLATVDDRFFGSIPDGQQMLSSAVALSRWGELGVSSAYGYVGKSPRGGTYSRYGTAQSVAEVPAALGARALAAARPEATPGPLFVLVPILSLAVAAAAACAAALALGASPPLAALSGAGLVLATPLWAYSGSDLSEPLQAALLALALAAALHLRRLGPSPRLEWAAGLLAGLPPLAKSSLWPAVVPLLLLAASPPPETAAKDAGAPRGRKRRGGPSPGGWRLRVLAGFGVAFLSWAALDLYRFGKLFGGYDQESFAYPPLTGLLRLTLLPNKGLLFYAPALLLAPLGLARLWREERRLFWTLSLPVATVFATAAGWWAWDGQAAWGPRLVLPSLPFLVLAAVPWLAGAARPARAAALLLLLAGVLVNGVGALQPFPGVYSLASTVAPAPIPPGRAEGTPYEIETLADGSTTATAPHHLSLTPSWSPQRVTFLVLGERVRGGDVSARLAAGLGLEPPFAVRAPQNPSLVFRAASSPFRWPYWGRSWLQPDGTALDPWATALFDQAVRAADARDWRRALSLGQEVSSWPAGRRDARILAVGAEAAFRSGDPAEARRLAAGAPPCHPWVLYVTDAELGDPPGPCVAPGEEERRRAFLEEARARGLSVTEWARAGGLL